MNVTETTKSDDLAQARNLLYLRARMVCRRYADHQRHGTERTADRWERACVMLAEAFAGVRELADAEGDA